MEENFSAMLYAKHYSSNNESWDAELAHKFTVTPNPGFWFNKGVFDEESQQESAELTHGEWLGTAEKYTPIPESGRMRCCHVTRHKTEVI